MSDLSARWAEVVRRVERAAARAGRSAAEVRVVAVSKSVSADVVAGALDAGIVDLGENRAQELRDKASVLGDRPRWHFVGHLQTNKVRLVAGIATLVHSVDRYGLGEALARRARALGGVQEVLVQVNVGREPVKQGVEPERARALAAALAELDGLAVGGVMTIPPLTATPAEARPFFRALAEVGADVAAAVPGATHLSMGMSRDFEVAVEEGATLVRVGEAIFGPRRSG